MKIKFCAWFGGFALLLVLTTNLFAGDFSTLNFIGFSRDNRFLAFEEYGTQDGSGFSYSNFYFVDVEKNAFAAKPVRAVIEQESATEAAARRKARAAATPKLRELKIVEGNTGDLLVSRLLTDLNGNPQAGYYGSEKENSAEIAVRFAREVFSNYRDGDFTLTLKPVAVNAAQCESSEGFGGVYLLDLTLRDNQKNEPPKVLQKDRELPSNRGCPLRYHIQSVYVRQNVAAVFINVFTVGFEGADARLMVVTGTLD